MEKDNPEEDKFNYGYRRGSGYWHKGANSFQNWNHKSSHSHSHSYYYNTTNQGDQSEYRRRRRRICCVNCGREGHLHRDCQGPATSFGIIAVRRRTPTSKVGPVKAYPKVLCDKHHAEAPPDLSIDTDDNEPLLFLMVQRKDTMGFIDFVRGRESNDENMLITYLEEMTCAERQRLVSWTFDEIWDNLWLNHSSKCYLNEYKGAKEVFEALDIPSLIQKTACKWSEQEYGFPKGRKTMGETNYQCSMREFCEETGYRQNEVRILSNEPIEENFIGTNGKPYRHVYYIAEVPDTYGEPRLDNDNIQQVGEVRNVSWFTYSQCCAIIRPYDTAKRDVLRRVRDVVNSMFYPTHRRSPRPNLV